MMKLLKRCSETAIKLPFAIAWDVVTLGNMGEKTSTEKVIEEHRAKKQLDDIMEVISAVKEIER